MRYPRSLFVAFRKARKAIEASSLIVFLAVSLGIGRQIHAAESLELNFETVAKLIEEKHVQSVENLLELLPKTFLDHYVLMHQSQSLQASSYDSPRAIVYGNDSTLTMAFGGHAQQFAGNDIEFIQYRSSSRSFEFREISFASEVGTGGRPRVSQANPAVCLGCHGGDDPRPNWEPYNRWPGAFGSVAAGISIDRSPESALQLEPFRKFIQNQAQHPRYRFLGQAYDTYYPSIGFYDVDSVGRLTQQLARLNIQRVVRLIQSKPHYFEYKFAILGAVFCEQPISPFLPPELAKIHEQKTFTKFEFGGLLGDEPTVLTRQLNAIFEPLGSSTQRWSMDFSTHGMLSSTHRFQTPNGDSEEMLLQELIVRDPELRPYAHLVFESNEMAQHSWPVPNLPLSPHGACVELREKSQTRLKTLGEKQSYESVVVGMSPAELKERIPDFSGYDFAENRTTPRLLMTCISCHASGNGKVPDLPFENPKALAKALNQKGVYPRGTLLDEILYRTNPNTDAADRMPPKNAGLQHDDLVALQEFFRSLARQPQ